MGTLQGCRRCRCLATYHNCFPLEYSLGRGEGDGGDVATYRHCSQLPRIAAGGLGDGVSAGRLPDHAQRFASDHGRWRPAACFCATGVVPRFQITTAYQRTDCCMLITSLGCCSWPRRRAGRLGAAGGSSGAGQLPQSSRPSTRWCSLQPPRGGQPLPLPYSRRRRRRRRRRRLACGPRYFAPSCSRVAVAGIWSSLSGRAELLRAAVAVTAAQLSGSVASPGPAGSALCPPALAVSSAALTYKLSRDRGLECKVWFLFRADSGR